MFDIQQLEKQYLCKVLLGLLTPKQARTMLNRAKQLNHYKGKQT